MEEDHSDNIGTSIFIIFNISEPNTLSPTDRFGINLEIKLNFLLQTLAITFRKHLSILYKLILQQVSYLHSDSGKLTPNKSLVNWTSPQPFAGYLLLESRKF